MFIYVSGVKYPDWKALIKDSFNVSLDWSFILIGGKNCWAKSIEIAGLFDGKPETSNYWYFIVYYNYT